MGGGGGGGGQIGLYARLKHHIHRETREMQTVFDQEQLHFFATLIRGWFRGRSRNVHIDS